MPLIPVLPDLQAGDFVDADQLDSMFASIRDVVNTYGLLSDVARTVTVQHTYSAGLKTASLEEATPGGGISVVDDVVHGGAVSFLGAVTGVGFTDLSGSIASAQVPVAAVTQHQASLAIAFTQLTGVAQSAQLSGSYTGITGVGTLAAGAVPASLVTAGVFGAGVYTFPGALTVAGAATISGSAAFAGVVDLTAAGPLRVYSAATFRGGLGLSSWAWGDAFNNVAIMANPGHSLELGGEGVKAVVFGAAGAASFQGNVTAAGNIYSPNVVITALGKLYLDGGSDTYITEGAANIINFFAGGTSRLGITSTSIQTSVDLAIPAANKFYLDGGSDTYLTENAANNISVVTGGLARLDIGATIQPNVSIVPQTDNAVGLGTAAKRFDSIYAVTGRFSNLAVAAGNVLYFDGGNDTYMFEVAADTMRFVTGAATRLDLSGAGATFAVAVTAPSVSGDGSGLTSLPAAQLSGVLPALDGSALTGLVRYAGAGTAALSVGVAPSTAGGPVAGINLLINGTNYVLATY